MILDLGNVNYLQSPYFVRDRSKAPAARSHSNGQWQKSAVAGLSLEELAGRKQQLVNAKAGDEWNHHSSPTRYIELRR